MSIDFAPVGRTVEILQAAGSVLQQTIYHSAAACLRMASNDAKILVGLHIYCDALAVRAIRERLGALGVHEYACDKHDAVSGMLSARSTRSLFEAYRASKVGLAKDLGEHQDSAHALWDAPTRTLAKQLLATLGEEIREVTELLDQIDDSIEPNDVPMAELPGDELPTREPRFEIVDDASNAPEDLGFQERLVFELHLDYMTLEIPSIEHCARLITEFRDMPWDFVVDMARQASDEARHACAFRTRMEELGGYVGMYPIDHSLERMKQGQPLEVRLAIHQRLGERIGVDAAIWMAGAARKHGDEVTAALFEFICHDEIAHVAGGNRWIEWLEPSVSDRKKVYERAWRARLNGDLPDEESPMIFPFQRWATEAAGYSAEDVESMARRYERFGSIIP